MKTAAPTMTKASIALEIMAAWNRASAAESSPRRDREPGAADSAADSHEAPVFREA